MYLREKLSEYLEWSIPVWWGFVVGIGVGMVFYNSGRVLPEKVFGFSTMSVLLILAVVFFVVGLVYSLTKYKRFFLVSATVIFGFFWFFKSVKIDSPNHLTAKELSTQEYKFLNKDCILLGTISSDPDIRESFTYILIKPQKIVLSLNKYRLVLNEEKLKEAIVEKDFVKDIVGDVRFRKVSYPLICPTIRNHTIFRPNQPQNFFHENSIIPILRQNQNIGL